MYIISLMFMIVSGAVCGMFAFIELHLTGAPLMGYVIAGSVACFVGGWVEIAKLFCDEV